MNKMATCVGNVQCPVCSGSFVSWMINDHIEQCLKKSTSEVKSVEHDKIMNKAIKDVKPPKSHNDNSTFPPTKKVKLENLSTDSKAGKRVMFVPLAEKVRPQSLQQYVGQSDVVGDKSFLKNLLETDEVPSMIFWGPPGCGKTTLANIIANRSKQDNTARFVKLSATMSGVSNVKDAIKVAKNEQTMFRRKTILFVDEIHRFNKLQQDTFLPHIEDGTITLIGATTENPSFHVNSALLSRCRVIVLHKLSTGDIVKILHNGVAVLGGVIHKSGESCADRKCSNHDQVCMLEDSLVMLANLSDGDARGALNGLEIAYQSKLNHKRKNEATTITVGDIKASFQRSHVSYDKNGEEHYNIISALHKSVRGSDENAALYWLGRMLVGGEEPLYIARRLVRMASEDIGLADPLALNQTVSAFQACHFIGRPECDVILAQATVYLARAPKSVEVYKAYNCVVEHIKSYDGVLPGVPYHLRNAPTKLLKDIGYAKGYKYNPDYDDHVDQDYLPREMKGVDFFQNLKA